MYLPMQERSVISREDEALVWGSADNPSAGGGDTLSAAPTQLYTSKGNN